MKKTTSFLPELEKASGHFDYPLTNDYMFRSLCQKSNKALKGLISALLHIPPEQIHSVVITNPIVVGEAYEDKEFRLDVRVELRNCEKITLPSCLSLSPIAQVKKPRHSPLCLRFLTCALEDIYCAIWQCYLFTVPKWKYDSQHRDADR